MDISKMCSNNENVETINGNSLTTNESIPTITELHLNNIVNNSAHTRQYQLQYQLQHQYLKLYKDTPSNFDPILPPLKDAISTEDQPMENEQLKQIIEQCTLVYQKIAKYRSDPLREAERNQIIDEVYFTSESMLTSLKELLNTSTNEEDEPSISGNESNNEEYKMIRQARNLQKNTQFKYKRRSRTNMVGHRCHSCNTTDTPEWRRGPDGARTLCNACGLHYSKLLRKGSLTIQTHNYTIEHPVNKTIKKTPRSIQFPIIPLNKSIHPIDTTTTTATTNNSHIRIMEIHDDNE